MTLDPIVAATEAHIARQDAGAAALERAYTAMQRELIDALQHDPARKVGTPGWRHNNNGVSSAAAVVIDDSYCDAGMEDFLRLLRAAGEASRSTEVPQSIRLSIMAAISGIAARHAAQHAEEASWD